MLANFFIQLAFLLNPQQEVRCERSTCGVWATGHPFLTSAEHLLNFSFFKVPIRNNNDNKVKNLY